MRLPDRGLSQITVRRTTVGRRRQWQAMGAAVYRYEATAAILHMFFASVDFDHDQLFPPASHSSRTAAP